MPFKKSVEKSNENSQIDLTVEEGISRVQGKSFLFSAELMKFLRAAYSVMEEGENFQGYYRRANRIRS